MSIPTAPRTRAAYTVALAGYFLLFLQLFLWMAWWSPPHNVPKSLALILMLGPLLLPLRGLLQERPMSFVWLALLSLLYMVHGMVVAYSVVAERTMALIELALAIAMYGGAVAYARWRGKELKKAWTDSEPS